MAELILRAQALTREAFSPFGEVIWSRGRESRLINEGTSQRYDDLARVDVQQAGGRPLISIFHALPRALPLRIRALERHPLSSQAFYPLQRQAYLVVVAEGQGAPRAAGVRAFLCAGDQGVNYARGTWHHSLIAIDQPCDFLVIDRGGPETNCEEHAPVGDEVVVVLG